MSTATASAQVTSPARRGRRPRTTAVAGGSVALAAAGLLVIVGVDGSVAARLLRAVLVVGAAVALVSVVRRGPSLGRDGLLWSFGAMTTAAGAGIAGYHWLKVGAQPVTLAGTAVLAGGLVTLVIGGAGLVRRTRGWWRVAVVPALVLATGVVLLALGQAVMATNVPSIALGEETPAAHGLAAQDVTFSTADGVRLSGWYVPSRTGAAVAVLHGSGSTRTSVLDQVAVLARHGYGVLAYDARGHGRSDGRAMEFGWYGDADVAGAVTFLTDRPDVDPARIGVVGLSMGGEQALGAAAADDRIAAVVAEGAGQRVAGDKAWLVDVYGLQGRVQQGIDRLTFGLTDLLTDAAPPPTLRTAVGAMAPRPALLVTAGAVPDEQHAADWIAAAAPDRISTWSVEGAGHTEGLATAPAAWEQRVTGFLDDALASAP